MLADFLTMGEHSGKEYGDLTFAFVGDQRFNMGRSLLVTGALMGSDVRMVGPAELAPPADVVAIARDIAAETGATITITDDVDAGVAGVDFVHTDVWVSMGEAKDVWNERVELLRDYQVNASLHGASGQPRRQVHALPAGLPRCRHDGRRRGHGGDRACPTGSRSATTSSSRPPASSSTRPRTACTRSRL